MQVTSRRRPANTIGSRSPVLSADGVAEVAHRALVPWPPTPGTKARSPRAHHEPITSTDGDSRARFAHLRSEVDAAAHRHLGWAFGVLRTAAVPTFLMLSNAGAFSG